MDNTTKNDIENANSCPHTGKLVESFIFKNRINRSELARQMNVSSTSVYQYAKSSSLPLGILWKISLLLDHNFVAEIGEMLPVQYASKREKELEQRIKTLEKKLETQLDTYEKQIERLSMEVSVYKNIVGK